MKFGRYDWDSPYRNIMESYMYMTRTHRNILERKLNQTGVYRSQHQILMSIVEHPNVSQKEIAKKHHVSTATIAVSLKKLEKGGYIKRVVDQEDNRFNQICITPKGEAVVEKSIRFFQKVEQTMFDGFTEEELGTMEEYFSRIRQNLCRMQAEEEEGMK